MTENNSNDNSMADQFELSKGEIKHMVIFNLKYEIGSVQANEFLEDARRILSTIPVVHHFQVLRQVSFKNDYDYGFSMIFGNRNDYEVYNNHPHHITFVESHWNKEVSRFLEIDFEI